MLTILFLIYIRLLFVTASLSFLYFFYTYLFSLFFIYLYLLFIFNFFKINSILLGFPSIHIRSVFVIVIIICTFLMIEHSLPPISFIKIVRLIVLIAKIIVFIVSLAILSIAIVIIYSSLWLPVGVIRIILSISPILTIITIVI